MILKKLLLNLRKHILYKKHLNGLLHLFKTLEFAFQQNFKLLAAPFIKGGSRKPAICDRKLFATIVHGCDILIWLLDVAAFVI